MYNSEMSPGLIDEFCRLSDDDNEFIKKIYERMGMSARGLHKILKVARTIADYNGNKNIGHNNLSEAVSFRNIEEKYWKGSNNQETKYATAYMQ